MQLSGPLPLNPVPRMAKTLDNISETSATNYLFLFAQRTLALQNEPPTPPPLNALGLPCNAISLLWAWVQKQKQKKHLDMAKESAAPAEVEEPSASENAASAKLKGTVAKATVDKARLSTGSANSDETTQDKTARSVEETLTIGAVALEVAAGDAARDGVEAAAAVEEEEAGGNVAATELEWATDKAHASVNEGEDKEETFAEKIKPHLLNNEPNN